MLNIDLASELLQGNWWSSHPCWRLSLMWLNLTRCKPASVKPLGSEAPNDCKAVILTECPPTDSDMIAVWLCSAREDSNEGVESSLPETSLLICISASARAEDFYPKYRLALSPTQPRHISTHHREKDRSWPCVLQRQVPAPEVPSWYRALAASSTAKMSDAQANEAEKNIEIWKVKKLIKRLEAARGNGTSMISLIIRE